MVKSASGKTNVKPLKLYGCDLVGQVGKMKCVLGRRDDVRKVISIFTHRKKKGALLIGESGVGKIDAVMRLAQMISHGDVLSNLNNVQVIALDILYTNEFEDRLKAVLEVVQKAQVKVILFIDNIHLVHGRTKWSIDVGDLPCMIAMGQLWCIGGTTPEEHKKYLKEDPFFEKNFQQVLLDELSVPDTISMLRGLKERYEKHHGVRICDSALVVAAQLSSQYITATYLPDKAINLVDEACADVKAQLDTQHEEEMDSLDMMKKEKDQASGGRLVKIMSWRFQVRKGLLDLKDKLLYPLIKYKKKKERRYLTHSLDKSQDSLARVIFLRFGEILDIETKKGVDENVMTLVRPHEIAEVVSRWTDIPLTKLLTTDDFENLRGLANRLHQRVAGQDQAINDVVNAVIMSRTGLGILKKQPNIALILFVGPNGVAKTELAKALAQELFHHEKFLIRISMPRFSGDVMDLAEVVKRNCYGIVIFDGVDKTHEPMFINDLFLILNDGLLSNPDTVLIVNVTTSIVKEKETHHFKHLVDSVDATVVFD